MYLAILGVSGVFTTVVIPPAELLRLRCSVEGLCDRWLVAARLSATWHVRGCECDATRNLRLARHDRYPCLNPRLRILNATARGCECASRFPIVVS